MPIPPGPPFDLDVLADLHAGVYPEEVAAVLRARVATDPEATATLAALDATVADLQALPPVPIPTQVAARLDAAIATELAAAAARVSVGTGSRPPQPGPTPAPDSSRPPESPSPPRQATQPPFRPAPSGPAVPPPRTGTGPRPAGGVPGQAGTPPDARQHGTAPSGADTTPPPAPLAQVSSLDQARRSRQQRGADARRRQTRWATGLGIAAAVAAVVTIGAVVFRPGSTPGTGLAGEPVTTTSAPAESSSQEPAPGNATGEEPGAGAAPTNGASEPTDAPSAGVGAPAPGGEDQQHAVVAEPHHLDKLLPKIDGSEPEGPFSNPLRLASCLAANHADSHHVLGVLPVTYTGKQAYAISVRTSQNTVRILIVSPTCGQSGAELLDEQTTTG